MSFWTYYRLYKHIFESTSDIPDDHFYNGCKGVTIQQFEDLDKEEIIIFYEKEVLSEYYKGRKNGKGHNECMNIIQSQFSENIDDMIEKQKLNNIPKW